MTSEVIDKIETAVVAMQDDTLATSYGPSVSIRKHVFVRLWSSSGAFGIGEASPLPHFTGETWEDIEGTIQKTLAPALIGLNPFDVEKIESAMNLRIPHHTTAKAAIVTAVYDLMGKLIALPVCRLLGGRLRDEIEFAAGVGIAPVAETVEKVRQYVKSGVNTVKLKIGVDPKRDIETVLAVRSEFGPKLNIRADANQGYTPKVAVEVLRQLEEAGLQYVEQPVAADDLEGLRFVRSSTSIRVAVDESLYSLKDAMHLISTGACDVFVIKLIKTAGIRQGRSIIALAAANRIPCVVVSPYEGVAGMAADIHVAAASPNVLWAVELEPGKKETDDPVTGLKFGPGKVEVPTAPGLGVELTRDPFKK